MSMHSHAAVAAVRGAISVRENSAEAILEATAGLLTELARVNDIEPARIISIVFTATRDLDADFPAHAARKLGWDDVPLLSANEIDVPGARPRVVRVLMTVSGMTSGHRLRPAYLGEAAALRPDFAKQLDAGFDSASVDRDAPPGERLAIIGLGQIGGSIGLAIGNRSGWVRAGYDHDAAVLRLAHGAGAVDVAAGSAAEAVRDATIVVIATPVDGIPSLVDACAQELSPGATLVDTGSARTALEPALEGAAARGIHAIGFHPLAGTEGSSFRSARANLFQGVMIAIVPARGAATVRAEKLAAAIGARSMIVGAEEHDRALARTSHLPYLLALALSEAGGEFAKRGLSGPGYRDMTRLAASDATMANAYCRANAIEVASAWRELRRELDARVFGIA